MVVARKDHVGKSILNRCALRYSMTSRCHLKGCYGTAVLWECIPEFQRTTEGSGSHSGQVVWRYRVRSLVRYGGVRLCEALNVNTNF